MKLPHQLGKRHFKPSPPKRYEPPASLKPQAVTKTSPSVPQSIVATISDADIGMFHIEKDYSTEENEDYSYVSMSPKDANIKQNSSSLVNEIRNDNKQYLSSLNMEEVGSYTNAFQLKSAQLLLTCNDCKIQLSS